MLSSWRSTSRSIKSRFKGKRVMEVPTSVVLKASKQIINKIEESLNA